MWIARLGWLTAVGLLVWAFTAAASDDIERGRKLAFNPTKGNCLACHLIENADSPGDLGPPLVAIRARFPDKHKLRMQLWDPMAQNPASRMPPFGRHRILTEDELDRIIDYIYSL